MLLVGIGGILGAMTRFVLGKWITGRTSTVLPLGTLIINITGSFLLGILAVLHLSHAIPEWLWNLLGIGYLGAYTTFSTFGVEAIQMLKNQDMKNAIIYVTLSVFLGILFAWIGTWAAGGII